LILALGVDPDQERAVLLLESIAAEPALGVTEGGAGAHIELPEVLETRQHGPIVNALLERNRLVRAHRLIREVLPPGVDDQDLGTALDGELLHAVPRHLGRST